MSLLRLLLLLTFLVAVAHGVVVEWGYAQRTGFPEVATPLLLPAQVLSTSANGSTLPDFFLTATNEFMTIAMTSSYDFYIWGLVGETVQAPRKLVLPSSFPLTSGDPVIKLVGADNLFFALTASGKVYSWTWSGTTCPSSNLFGRSLTAPNDCSVPSTIPSAVKLPGKLSSMNVVRDFSCASTYCVARDSSDAVYAWSDPVAFENRFDYTLPSSLPTNLVGVMPTSITVSQIATSEDWFFIVTSNATDPVRIWSFGNGTADGKFLNPAVQADVPYHFVPSTTHAVLSGISPKYAAAGLTHGLLASSGDVYAWGSNSHGQLGASHTVAFSYTPNKVTLPGGTVITSISAVGYTSYVLTQTGGIYVWGASSLCSSFQCDEWTYGFFGDLRLTVSGFEGAIAMTLPDGFAATSLPTPTSLSNNIYSFHLLGTQGASTALPLGQELLLAWGSIVESDGDSGLPLGNLKFNPKSLSPTPTIVSLPSNASRILSVVSRADNVRVLAQYGDASADPEIFAWGSMTYDDVNLPSSDGSLTPALTTLPYPISGLLNATTMGSSQVTAIATSQRRFYVQTANGELTSYWKGEAFSIFSGMTSADTLMCGDSHCAIYRADSKTLYTFQGERGTCYPTGRSTCMESPTFLSTPNPVLAVALGDDFTVVLTDTTTDMFLTVGACYWYNGCIGTLSNWYFNSLSPIDSSQLPAGISPSDISSLTAGAQHVMFLFKNSTTNETELAGWGWNQYGQVFGQGSGNTLLPQVIPSSWYQGTPVAVSGVSYSTFLMTEVGGVRTVWIWGYNGWPRFYGGLQDAYDSRYESQAFLFQLPGYLSSTLSGYTMKSLPSTATGKGIMMILTNDPALQTNPTNALCRNAVDLTAHSFILGVGDDTEQTASSYPDHPTIFTNLAAPTQGTPLPLGDGTDQISSSTRKGIPAGETISQLALGNFVHWYLTASNRVYAAGYTVVLPPMLNANIDISEVSTARQLVPVLFFDATQYGAGNVVKLEAYGRSAVVLLQNGTAVSFFSASENDWQVGKEMNEFLNDGHAQDQPFQVPSTWDDVSCTLSGCCFLSLVRDEVGCFGDFPGGLTFNRLFESPTIVVSSVEIDSIHLLETSLVYRTKDGVWHSKYNATTTVITGDMPTAATVVQAAKSSHHLVILTGYGLMYSYGESTYGQANATCNTGAFCKFQHDDPNAQGVVQVAAWGSSTVWLPSASYQMYASGVRFWASEERDLVGENVASPSTSTPALVSFDYTNYSVMKLFSRSSYSPSARAASSTQTNRLILVSAVVGARPPSVDVTFEPLQPPPSSPPTTAPAASTPTATSPPTASSCTGTAPFTGCTCGTDLTWHCTGSIIVTQPTTINGPTVIQGDLTVSTAGGLSIDASTTSTRRPLLTISGCFRLDSPLSVLFNEAAVKAVPSKGFQELIFVDSSAACTITTSTLTTLQQTARKCRTISGGGQLSADSSGRSTLSGLFNVTKDKCDYWWIILVAVVGSVIVATALIVLLFMKSKVLRQKVQPYRGSN